MKKSILALLLISSRLFAQLPNTDIWLLDVRVSKDTIMLSNPVNITNRPGYDNQPAFSPDGKYILYTSIRDEKQSDIYKYDLKTKQIKQFEKTPTTSEYSPTFMPDGKNISVVMVEPDSAQRLWKFSLQGGKPSLIMDKVDSIGYHCWLDNNNVALFQITNPFQLVFTDITSQKSSLIVRDTIWRGMSLQMRKEGPRFFYAYKDFFYSVDPSTKKHTPFCMKNYPGEDFCFINNTLLISDNSIIYKNISQFSTSGNDWSRLTDLSKYGIKKITRMAVSPDGTKMAIVAE